MNVRDGRTSGFTETRDFARSLTPNPSPGGRGEIRAEMVGQPFPNFSAGAALTRRVRADTACRSTRRAFLIAVAWPALAWTGAVRAQARQPILIGWLSFSSRESGARSLAALKEGLAALGWKEGSQVRIEERWADGQDDRLASFTQELAAKKPALIVASTLRVAVSAAKGAPKIPIVMVGTIDPVAAGLVTSLARPGGMVTGVAGFGLDLAGKHVELLLAAAPKVKRVGFLVPSKSAVNAELLEVARRSTTYHSVEARFAEVAKPEDIEPAMLRLAKDGAQGLVILPVALFGTEWRRIVKLALAQRWPVVGASRWAETGALLSYGADHLANHRRAAWYVDRILKGAKPGDLPIERPMRFELVINMKTAKALGITIPPSLLVQAERVIE